MRVLINRGKWIVLTILGLVLLWSLFKAPNPRILNLPRSIIVDATRPVLSVTESFRSWLSEVGQRWSLFWEGSILHERLESRIEQLEMENQSLKMRLALYQDLSNVKSSLNNSMRFSSARILAFDPISATKSILIDHGKLDGVTINQVVVSADGLVGKVVEIFDHSSRVLLAIDGGASVDAINRRTRSRCLVSGLNNTTQKAKRMPFLTQLEYVDGSQEFQIGDELITSGIGGVFPEGIKLGKIHSVSTDEEGLFSNALIRPSVDFAKLTHVYLLENLIK